ncbi:hypothetical protein SELMODRAFT_403192 [Selaginella moellendorffii]|uniref:Uncharacterized protein n=1 Tax=Selaginella moellendorffii TaxID=88036 RepID=D8QTD4_SELML|nr:hypothetical protein SELMODRAFT_403192 [Selaginella moellendorffii]
MKKKEKQRQLLGLHHSEKREVKTLENVEQVPTFHTQKKHQRNPGVDDEDNHLWTIRSHEKEIRAALSATSEAAGSRGTNVKSQAYEEMSMQSCKGSSTLKLGVHRLSVATLGDLPPMDALEFNNNLLICGSYSSQNGSGIVHIWDSITDAAGTVVVTGCFRCLQFLWKISPTANKAVVWDTRLMPMETRDRCVSSPLAVATPTPGSRSTKALHYLSRGKPMPARWVRGFVPTCFVGAGDQGGNYALWFSSEWRNGSVALWDVTLGEPCPVSIGCWYFLFKFCFFV